jgi:hypothetical protein
MREDMERDKETNYVACKVMMWSWEYIWSAWLIFIKLNKNTRDWPPWLMSTLIQTLMPMSTSTSTNAALDGSQ